MTKYPLFTEILGKPSIISIHFRGHMKPKHRKSIWFEKIIISDPVHAVLSRINFSRHLLVQRGGEPPKNDDVIYEQPLMVITMIIMVMMVVMPVVVMVIPNERGQPQVVLKMHQIEKWQKAPRARMERSVNTSLECTEIKVETGASSIRHQICIRWNVTKGTSGANVNEHWTPASNALRCPKTKLELNLGLQELRQHSIWVLLKI